MSNTYMHCSFVGIIPDVIEEVQGQITVPQWNKWLSMALPRLLPPASEIANTIGDRQSLQT